MYSKYTFPVSMENLPQSKGFCCVSLRVTSSITALLLILYSVLGLAVGVDVVVKALHGRLEAEVEDPLATSIILVQLLNHIVNFFLSVFLIIGVLKNKLQLMKPWLVWVSVQVMVGVVVFVYAIALNTMTSQPSSALLLFVIQFLKLLVLVYMLVQVSSYYRQLEQVGDSERQRVFQVNDSWYTHSAQLK